MPRNRKPITTAEAGRRGGVARARKLSAERRVEIARKASQAAAKARTLKAEQAKAKEEE